MYIHTYIHTSECSSFRVLLQYYCNQNLVCEKPFSITRKKNYLYISIVHFSSFYLSIFSRQLVATPTPKARVGIDSSLLVVCILS